jgi:hypothetical protein
MARPKSKINEAKSEVIESEILKENPDGLPETVELPKVDIVKVLPKMETVIFRNDRDPGQVLEFHYHTKTHRLHHYKLYHGKQYTLPTEVVEHLEERCVPMYGYRRGPEGSPEMYITGYKHQFSCKVVRAA